MIDYRALLSDYETIESGLKRRSFDTEILKNLKKDVEANKEKRLELENLQADQNSMSKMFGQYKKEGKDIAELKAKVDANKEKMSALNDEVRDAEEAIIAKAMAIPNIPDEDVPNGADEYENVELKKVLEPKEFSFEAKEHWELAEKTGVIDFERGVKLAKSRFSVLRGDAARMERALINFMIDFNRERGFEEVYVPFMANSDSLRGTGQLPKFEEDLFKIDGEDLYMIPTAEVSLTNLVRDEIIPEKELPMKLTGYTPCFRKEAGSAGRDTRGIIRQHQFDKVELVCITKPEQSDAVFEEMISCASDMLKELGLPHRHMQLCTGDMGFSAAKTVDLEVWLPGQNRYREISSISNTREFQARRAKIRCKDGKKNILAHTLNGSSLAVGRTLLAIMENYQNEDGTFDIPEALERYM